MSKRRGIKCNVVDSRVCTTIEFKLYEPVLMIRCKKRHDLKKSDNDVKNALNDQRTVFVVNPVLPT